VAAVAALPEEPPDAPGRSGLMAPNGLPRPNELVDPGTPNILSADASPGRSKSGRR
jgi:hypothetical protein